MGASRVLCSQDGRASTGDADDRAGSRPRAGVRPRPRSAAGRRYRARSSLAPTPRARSAQAAGVRPGAVRALHDGSAERHVALPVAHARVAVAFEVSRAAGERNRGENHRRPSTAPERSGAIGAPASRGRAADSQRCLRRSRPVLLHSRARYRYRRGATRWRWAVRVGTAYSITPPRGAGASSARRSSIESASPASLSGR